MDIIVIQHLVTFTAGMILLWWAGDKTVRYTHEVSHIFGLSTFFLGFVLMAVSTGFPELIVTITAVWSGAPSLAAGDIVGSNLGDISLVLGIPATFMRSINVLKGESKNLLVMLFITMLAMSTVFVIGSLTKMHGVGLIVLYAYCLWILWKSRHVKKIREEAAEVSEKTAKEAVVTSKMGVIIKLAFSLFGLTIASKLSVSSAMSLAEQFNLSLGALGATVFAVGTSLPELSVNINAVKQKDYSMALGNALGSVLEQGTLLLGFLAIIAPHPVHLQSFRYIAPFMFFAFAVVSYGVIKREKINRVEGIVLLILYATFLVYNYHVRLRVTS